MSTDSNDRTDSTDRGDPTPRGGAADRKEIIERVREGMRVAGGILADYTPGRIESEAKRGGDPVTAADLAVDDALRKLLPRPGEGWLSEETARSPERLKCRHVWIVDPIDGTKEFIRGVPEWCVSIGYVEDGGAVAGGIFNPVSNELIVGAVGIGVWLNDEPVTVTNRTDLNGAIVLASRSETARGEWKRFENMGLDIRPTGSVAYKLGLVAAGRADATWTLVPKSEWDVAAGVALVHAAGGKIREPKRGTPRFNREPPVLSGLLASNAFLIGSATEMLD